MIFIIIHGYNLLLLPLIIKIMIINWVLLFLQISKWTIFRQLALFQKREIQQEIQREPSGRSRWLAQQRRQSWGTCPWRPVSILRILSGGLHSQIALAMVWWLTRDHYPVPRILQIPWATRTSCSFVLLVATMLAWSPRWRSEPLPAAARSQTRSLSLQERPFYRIMLESWKRELHWGWRI